MASAAPRFSPPHLRRFDYDVTNTINVSSADAVRDEVQRLFISLWPTAANDELWLGFHDFRRLFEGARPGFIGCDTVYHDIQHTLDMTLAMARLIGYAPSPGVAASRATFSTAAISMAF